MIEAVSEQNFKDFVALFSEMFSKETEPEKTCRALIAGNKEFPFLYVENGNPLGFLSMSVRHDYVNGTKTSPVAFVEAVYVRDSARRRGIGRELMDYAREFARERGFTEIASDCGIENTASERFHKACGFRETERVICFAASISEMKK